MSSNSNSPPNLLVVDNSFLPYKPKPHFLNKYANTMLPFFSSLFLLSIFIMIISIIKNISIPSLLNSTIFWFFISNTLIFIIAVDYAIFSLSQHKRFDLYENHSPPNQTQLQNIQFQSPSLFEFDEDKETQREKLKIVVREHDIPPSSRTSSERALRRSMSEKPKRSASKKSKKMMARRSESVKYNETMELEENEFSKMSNEELNKRVEEFIQRFNRQMRLQTRAELKSLVLRD